MRFHELQGELDRLGIPHAYYSLAGGNYSETVCIVRENGEWLVYYSERGRRKFYGTFDDEEKACACFLEKVKNC